MTPRRFQTIVRKYPGLRIAVLGDFSLDRYLEIDPARSEVSIETGLRVHNVVNVRAQPGSAGTILNNLSALGIGALFPIGFCGVDGEGFELREALRAKPGVALDHFLQTSARCTFTYCKPLVLKPGKPPQELNRLDRKNWSPTPAEVQNQIIESLYAVDDLVDAIVVMDQVDVGGTGVITPAVLEAIHTVSRKRRRLPVIADSRRGLRGYPPVIFKMNGAELLALSGRSKTQGLPIVKRRAAELARANARPVFVTLAEKGIVGAEPDGRTVHLPSWPVRGAIDIVGAGDAVTANLAAALAAGARMDEAIEFANAAASIVIHQLGTTGTASVVQIKEQISLAKNQ
ncbi:carbohydrate kinase [bacterium]|nr:carbohydrate kinase [bacterium]